MLNELVPQDFDSIDRKMIFQLLPCQLRYVFNDSKILGVEKGRQLGFTWISAYKVLRKIFKCSRPFDTYWISRDEFSAKLFLMDVLSWLMFMNVGKNHKKEFKQDIIDFKGVQAMRISFPNGCNIYVLSSSIDAIAGKRGDIYIDEAALHKDFQQLFDIAKPATRWGGRLTFFSTHRSKTNYFYKLIKRIKDGEMPGAEVMTITLMDALNDGYLHRLNARAALIGDRVFKTNQEFFETEQAQASSEEMFLQENMCIPADADATQAVKEEELSKIMFPQSEIFSRPISGKKYFAGIDIGRNRDLTSLWIAEDVSNTDQPMLVTRHVEIMSKVDFAIQEKKLADALQRWKPRHCMIDGTNVGAMIAENLEKRFSFCQAIKITAVTRPRWISDLVSFIRRDPVSIKIPNSNEVWEDFLSVERYINKYGKEDFFIPSHGNRGHGDRFMSMVLCLQSFLSKRSLARYTLQSEGTVKEIKKPEPQKFRRAVRSRFKM